ncbi:hypothetical protein H6G17_08370 [Chroococcidiopsis sp. FACHB-1243]|uniref:hypothetical protein n=1 Tax=Chroococcidiopsis sp. [FACHB-1243] TaxID=2692781 RepID=UPI001781F662|nr:hypothetical protein [Chroococcidiopsis sp. [FACHB-1243]]MBD2305528.1 hypothetical protein [Chroococcidiopsis sp. [FACHB-1243]]
MQYKPNVELDLSPLNSEQNVNYGCNLKWKPGDEKGGSIAIAAIFMSKNTSKPSI